MLRLMAKYMGIDYTFENNFFKIIALPFSAFFGDRPSLELADPEIIKDINIKDFHLFVDRNDLITGDPMNDRSLFNLFGDAWKKMRSIVRQILNIYNNFLMKIIFNELKDKSN